MKMTIKHRILTAVGYIAVITGGIGIVVPVLPTVPLILLAALCFGSANPKMNRWLSENRYFGEYIDNYRTGSGVSGNKKICSIVLLWAMLLASMLILRENPVMIVILAIIGICVSAHVALLKKRRSCSIRETCPDDR